MHTIAVTIAFDLFFLNTFIYQLSIKKLG